MGQDDDTKPTSATTTVKQNKLASVLSGASSGALISTVLQPLDVLRTRVQADAAHNITTTTAQACRTVLAEEGIRGLWRGTSPTVLRLSLGVGSHFLALELIKDAFFAGRQQTGLGLRHGQLSPGEAFLSGGAARAIAAAISCPATLVKTRMEYRRPGTVQYKGTVSALMTIGRQEGVRGLFRGLGPTVLANAPFSAFYYMFYTWIKGKMEQRQYKGPSVTFGSGTVAAVAATLLTQPADVVRTRMQLASSQGVQLGMMQTLRGAMQSGGGKALLVGTTPRVLKRTLQTALIWTLYDELMPRLTRLSDRIKP